MRGFGASTLRSPGVITTQVTKSLQSSSKRKQSTPRSIMTVAFTFSALRLIAASLVACAFLMVPLAEARHLAVELESTCETSDHSDESGYRDAEERDHAGHEQHVYKCGACHAHFLAKSDDLDGCMKTTNQSLRPPVLAGPVSRSSSDLFRPPRL